MKILSGNILKERLLHRACSTGLRQIFSRLVWLRKPGRVFFCAVCCFLQACVIQPPARPDDPYYAPVLALSPVPDVASNGSLYRHNVALALFADRKATQIGDIITVVLDERTSSSKSSNIGVVKDSDATIPAIPNGVGTFFGSVPSAGSVNLGTTYSAEREFVGEAEADQSNRLSGNISVTVVNVFPNGTLAIRGEKWMTLNRGDEYIRISGLVRPDDVTPSNTVSSTKIANARITYSGEGDIANSQKMGWLSNFFNNPIWPF